MQKVTLLAVSTALIVSLQTTAVLSDELKTIVKQAYRDRIDDLTNGVYCKAISCEFDIEAFAIEETAPFTYRLDTTVWLKGTIPGLQGSAKREITFTGYYTRGTCIVKDVKAIVDTTEDNNGWGASRIAGIFRTAPLPANLYLEPSDCKKADLYLTKPS